MGCKESSLRSPDVKKKDDELEAKKAGGKPVGTEAPINLDGDSSNNASLSKLLPLNGRTRSPLLERPHGSFELFTHEPLLDGREAPNDMQLVSFLANEDNGFRMDDEYFLPSDSGTSTPLLFRIEPLRRAQTGEGTWEWWYDQVENLRITKDNSSRARLQDIPNRLTRQYDAKKDQVELDLGWCYMERSAPYVLGRLFVSPYLREIRWVTSLRLDGNYFTDDGFGNMLAVMGVANESKTVFPLLKNLYLNNMNLDHCSVYGILFYVFPMDLSCAARGTQVPRIAGQVAGLPAEAYMPFHGAPHAPLFPSLEVLSLCDNPGIGNNGLAEILRCFVAPHYERRTLPVLDLSRCGVDEVGVGYINEYLEQLRIADKRGDYIVVPRRVVLFGNRHSSSSKSSVDGNTAGSGVTLLM
ncbi:hypothetical protein, conserved [Trypanosoma cruzi]|uniref:Leucine-rich domain-containing protein n=1 Tax=Trypanosoma cruzi (strain CL Brener) TaxID=353153 RepID=Q4DWQ1_TRYCC|nr:hypothetical protein, conserved [Trypanosoma cruzi]EAN96953.1 hypothetical protein, conserved [Trypanosoma cruzi]|eukprot:XP_818804.1 hypothetical protein [Trypanosoma cruzi strain CL Brener]